MAEVAATQPVSWHLLRARLPESLHLPFRELTVRLAVALALTHPPLCSPSESRCLWLPGPTPLHSWVTLRTWHLSQHASDPLGLFFVVVVKC